MIDRTDKFANELTLPVRVTVYEKEGAKGKRQDVGTVMVPYPTLNECHDNLPAPDKFEPESEGSTSVLPVYEDGILQWIQDCIIEGVKREARNVTSATKDDDGTYKVSYVRDIPFNWAKLLEEHKRQGGAYLAQKWACIKAFEEWLATLDKSKAAIDMARAFMRTPNNLSTVAPEIRTKFREGYLEPWAASLSEDQIEEWDTHLSNVMVATDSEAPEAADF